MKLNYPARHKRLSSVVQVVSVPGHGDRVVMYTRGIWRRALPITPIVLRHLLRHWKKARHISPSRRRFARRHGIK